MIPPVLHQVWLGGTELPPQARLWQEGLWRLHPGWRYRLWTDGDVHTLPGAGLLRRCKSQSSRANVVRLAAVAVYGGVYLDCDCEGVRPLDDLLGLGAFAAVEEGDRLGNAVFGAAPDHPWVRWQLDQLPAYVDRVPPWGPTLMSAAPRAGLTVLPTPCFYPFLWNTPAARRRPAPESYVVHHWTMTWGRETPPRRHPEPDVPVHSYRADYGRLLRGLRPRLVVEWGPGLNTRLALKAGATVFSIEHDPEWIPRERDARLSVLLTPTDGDHYYLFPTEADLYFVDGRNRARCLEVIYARGRPDAVVCLHDAQRRAYREALRRFPHVLEPSPGFAVATRDAALAVRLHGLFGRET